MLITSLAASPVAGELSLELPIDCVLDDTCYIQQFVDHDSTADALDFQCGALTYDGHKGTDFALPSRNAQSQGVAVLAAAPGTVVGVRNDMPDILQIGPDAPDVSNRECGNGVVIRHADGWETQYCHLAEGSVTVTPNQTVDAGDTLGMVGLSGETQFPHLHFAVRQRGKVIDPFTPDAPVQCGLPSETTLWKDVVATPAGGLIATGFSAGLPAYEVIKSGDAHRREIAPDEPLVIWGYSFGSIAGDEMILSFEGPDGLAVRETITLDRSQAQLFRAFGKRAPDGGWTPGAYKGIVSHTRNGAVLDTQTTRTRVTSQ